MSGFSGISARLSAATLVCSAAALALAVGCLIALDAGQAAASQVRCGETITVDTVLHRDFTDCPNNGIVIGADDVTLDLNGHTIDGDDDLVKRCPRHAFCDVGVVNGGHDGVTVTHGSVREFAVGVWAAGRDGVARRNRVLGIASSRNRFAGIGLSDAARSLVRHSSGRGSISRENGVGIFVVGSQHNRILRNSFRHNGNQGIFVSDSTQNLIKGNLLSRNRFGIVMEAADRNRLRRNRSVRDGQIGIYVAPGSRNVIARNRVAHIREDRGGEGVAIEVDGGDRNVIARNSVRDTGGPGISVGFDVVLGNVVRSNHIRDAGEDGVRVDDRAKRTLVERNLAVGSGGDGFDVKGPTTKLTANRALRNAELGIQAVPGVIDGGGNRAAGNGGSPQCTNVTCRGTKK